MKRKQLPAVLDIVQVSDPAEVRAVAEATAIDRPMSRGNGLVTASLIDRVVGIMTLDGVRFPAMRARDDAQRAAAQDALWKRLNERAPALRDAPDELEALAAWVRGNDDRDSLGVRVQDVVGRCFTPAYRATPESWAAAQLLDRAPRTVNPLRLLGWRLSGEVERAKRLLASMVDGDLLGVHGTGLALHNIVTGIEKMRGLYRAKEALDASTVVDRCLVAPAGIMRQAQTDGTVAGCPFTRGTLFVLALRTADAQASERDLVFLDRTWSRCPANEWVPALLEGVWRRASR